MLRLEREEGVLLVLIVLLALWGLSYFRLGNKTILDRIL
jgi:hypothetical protein